MGLAEYKSGKQVNIKSWDQYLPDDLNNIEKLEFSFSDDFEHTSWLLKLTSLKNLELGNMNHKILPLADLRSLVKLEKFTVYNMGNCDILLSPKNLKQVTIAYSDITEIPDFIYHSKSLEGLQIHGSKVYHLDIDRLSRLKHLNYLNIGATNIFHEEGMKFSKLRPDVFLELGGRTFNNNRTDLFRIKPTVCGLIGCDCEQEYLFHCDCNNCNGEIYGINKSYIKINRECCTNH